MSNGVIYQLVPMRGSSGEVKAEMVLFAKAARKMGMQESVIATAVGRNFPDLRKSKMKAIVAKICRVIRTPDEIEAEQAAKAARTASFGEPDPDSDPIDLILERLEHYRPTGRDRWQATCPSHADRTPSLSVTRADDGRALLKCFAGCEYAEIMAAMGLSERDGFVATVKEDRCERLVRDARASTRPPEDDEAQPVQPGLLRIYTGQEILALGDETVDWVAEPFLARGAVTGLLGKVKASGKTTVTTYMLRAVALGKPFFGSPTRPSQIMYVTEQAMPSFAKSDTAGLLTTDGVYVLFHGDFPDMPWRAVVDAAYAECQKRGIDVIVFDTLTKLAGVKDENDNAGMARAMTPLNALAHKGMAVLALIHSGKNDDRGLYDSNRGASQTIGDLDIVLRLRRPVGRQRKTLRVLEVGGRYSDEQELSCELTPQGYILHGESEAVSAIEAEKAVASLPTEGMTIDQLQESNGISRTTLQRALEDAEKRGMLDKTGLGTKANPYVWRRK